MDEEGEEEQEVCEREKGSMMTLRPKLVPRPPPFTTVLSYSVGPAARAMITTEPRGRREKINGPVRTSHRPSPRALDPRRSVTVNRYCVVFTLTTAPWFEESAFAFWSRSQMAWS